MAVRTRRAFRYGERHQFGLSWEHLVVGIHQFDQNLVRPWRHPGEVDRIDVTRVRPPPGQVVDMGDPPRRDGSCAR